MLPQLVGDRVNVHYTVKDVQVGPHEKILHLIGSYTQEQVVVHLQDGWHETPVEPGHSVNLIAEKTVGSDGLLHATCDFNAGTPSLRMLCYLSFIVIFLGLGIIYRYPTCTNRLDLFSVEPILHVEPCYFLVRKTSDTHIALEKPMLYCLSALPDFHTAWH